MESDVVVIGGGPAGLICAATAAGKGKRVILFDKNKLLARKLRITGKGRCNVTNSADISDFINMVCSNSSFMYSAFYTFTNTDVIELFEKLGVPLKEERGGRVFPKSDSAKDIAEALIRYAKSSGVVIKNDKVTEIKVEDSSVCGVQTETGGFVPSHSVVIATGGMSYPLTGSTGDGYRFAESAGHGVIKPKASLVPLVTEEDYVSDLQGLSLKNVEIKIFSGSKPVYTDFGEMMFTHFGVTGPVILSASSNMDFEKNSRFLLSIDLKPALTSEQLDKRLLRDFEKYINKDFSNALCDLLPSKLIPTVIRLSGIEPHTKVNQINKSQRAELCRIIKNFNLTIIGTRPIEEAIITRGGVDVRQINPSTMESKVVNNLYFAGEVIDVDAYTGGYNLQIAFSTGYLAGISL